MRFVVAWIVFSAAIAAQPAALTISTLLDRYASGDFRGVSSHLSALTSEQADDVRKRFDKDARAWIGRAAALEKDRRTVIAATLALELEAARAESSEWNSLLGGTFPGRKSVGLAGALLVLRKPDEVERAWWRVANALAEGNRDGWFLAKPTAPGQWPLAMDGSVEGARRFPSDPRLALPFVIGLGMRFETVEEIASPSAGLVQQLPSLGLKSPTMQSSGELKRLKEAAIDRYKQLAANPVVGGEAAARLAYFQMTSGDLGAAAATAAQAAQNPNEEARYLGHFIGGRIAWLRGDIEYARKEFTSALAARPGSQSATLALASLMFRNGEVDEATALVRRSLDQRRLEDDPWRTFFYGDFKRLGSLLDELRKEVFR